MWSQIREAWFIKKEEHGRKIKQAAVLNVSHSVRMVFGIMICLV